MQLPFISLKILSFSMLLLGGVVIASIAQAEEDSPPVKADFSVTTEMKDDSHPHVDEGSESGFSVNGVQGDALLLERGETYIFDIDTGVKHDFYLSTTALGWGTATLTKGVKGNYTYNGRVTFTPDENTPDVVYYSCRNHKYVGGEIYIMDPE